DALGGRLELGHQPVVHSLVAGRHRASSDSPLRGSEEKKSGPEPTFLFAEGSWQPRAGPRLSAQGAVTAVGFERPVGRRSQPRSFPPDPCGRRSSRPETAASIARCRSVSERLAAPCQEAGGGREFLRTKQLEVPPCRSDADSWSAPLPSSSSPRSPPTPRRRCGPASP